MLMNFIWLSMIIISIVCGIATGNVEAVGKAALEGASSAVNLCISMGGALCLWCGIIEVMHRCGLSERLARLLRPLLTRLFPSAKQDPLLLESLASNVSANLLGLGNAATSSGIAAAVRLQERTGKTTASNELCLLVVLNTASIQLLPTTIASVRAALGASSAFDILPAVFLSSVFSVTVGITAARLLSRLTRV
ncbi:MAG: nucleoside recognition domain-containing protein [Oscillospiraceae bacterium]